MSALRPLVEELHERRAAARLGGGEEKIAKQHAADKLTARERLALLIDDGTFTELGIHARPHFSQRAMEGRDAPADGVITGYGKVDGRLVAVCAYDFTVMAGSMGMTGVRDLDGGERVELERAGVGTAPPDKLAGALEGDEVFVHLDLDVLDPSVLPAQFPAPGGLSSEGLRDLLGELAESATVIGVEITAFDAPEDEAERDRLAAMIESVVEPLL